ncbi:uncharacterized protein BDR25DRAFT_355857 [Lindgomyces ingoldianus]|uniref:Uncharacterized protein n=1 Tax=Lindgomyces ingoldianus TaxID=673940 RepID=A0ACB6QTG9_9PLEO|nr:uncharacterized protein BDR25DRAFT_355857 [Lindgomyces ingoldianus]KAF2470147.1 hypothetical protein BDR25DRAFT_355857 [Lindgomyces ingoldianus]
MLACILDDNVHPGHGYALLLHFPLKCDCESNNVVEAQIQYRTFREGDGELIRFHRLLKLGPDQICRLENTRDEVDDVWAVILYDALHYLLLVSTERSSCKVQKITDFSLCVLLSPWCQAVAISRQFKGMEMGRLMAWQSCEHFNPYHGIIAGQIWSVESFARIGRTSVGCKFLSSITSHVAIDKPLPTLKHIPPQETKQMIHSQAREHERSNKNTITHAYRCYSRAHPPPGYSYTNRKSNSFITTHQTARSLALPSSQPMKRESKQLSGANNRSSNKPSPKRDRTGKQRAHAWSTLLSSSHEPLIST